MIFECLELSMSQVKKSHQVKNQILTSPKSPKHFYLLLAFCKIQYSFTLRNSGLAKARPARPVPIHS